MRKLLILHTRSSTSHRGFTLVETLVAIAILMIAIAGPLVIATKGLTSALYSKDQMIASFLAQESMEIVKNTRDNNISGSRLWLADINGCTSSTPCDASSIGVKYQTCNVTIQPGCRIYYSDTSGYTADAVSTQTQFYRHFYLDPVTPVGASIQQTDVHVIVDWREGTIPFQIHLVSSMLSVTR